MTAKTNTRAALEWLQSERDRGTLKPNLAAALSRFEAVADELTDLLEAETKRLAFSTARKRREAQRLQEVSSVFSPTKPGSRPIH